MLPPPGWQDDPQYGKAKPDHQHHYPATTLRRKTRRPSGPPVDSDTYPPPPRRFATPPHPSDGGPPRGGGGGPPPPVPTKPSGPMPPPGRHPQYPQYPQAMSWFQHQEQLRHELQRELAHRRRSKSASSSERRNNPLSPDRVAQLARKSATYRHLGRPLSPPPPPYPPLPTHARTLPHGPPGRSTHVSTTSTDWLRAYQHQQIKSFDQVSRQGEMPRAQKLPVKSSRAKEFVTTNPYHPESHSESAQAPFGGQHPRTKDTSHDTRHLTEKHEPVALSHRAPPSASIDPNVPLDQIMSVRSKRVKSVPGMEGVQSAVVLPLPQQEKRPTIKSHELSKFGGVLGAVSSAAVALSREMEAFDSDKFYAKQRQLEQDRLEILDRLGLPESGEGRKSGHRERKSRRDKAASDKLKKQLVSGNGEPPESRDIHALLTGQALSHFPTPGRSRDDRPRPLEDLRRTDFLPESASAAVTILDEMIGEHLSHKERSDGDRQMTRRPKTSSSEKMEEAQHHDRAKSKEKPKGERHKSEREADSRGDRGKQPTLSSDGGAVRRKSRGPSEPRASQSNEPSSASNMRVPSATVESDGHHRRSSKLEPDKRTKDHHGQHPGWFGDMDMGKEESRAKSALEGVGALLDGKKKEKDPRKRHFSEKKDRGGGLDSPPVVPSHHYHHRNIDEKRDRRESTRAVEPTNPVDERQRKSEISRAGDRAKEREDAEIISAAKREKSRRSIVEHREKDQIAQEIAQKERLEKDLLERERLAKDLLDKDREAKELAERERYAREMAEKEKFAREMAEKERKTLELVEKERMAREMAERERRLMADKERKETLKLKLEKRLEEEILALQKQKRQLERAERQEREFRRRESCSGDRMREQRTRSRDPSLARSEVVRRHSSKRDSSADIVDAVEKILMWSSVETNRRQALEESRSVRDFTDGRRSPRSVSKRRFSQGAPPSPPCTCASPSPTDSGNQETVLEVPVTVPTGSHTWDHRSAKSAPPGVKASQAGYGSLPSGDRRKRDSSYHVEAEVERHPTSVPATHPLLPGHQSRSSRVVSPSWDSRSRSQSHHSTILRDLGLTPSEMSSSTRRHRTRRYSSKSYSYESDLDYERHLPSHGSRSCRCSIEHLDVEDEYSIYKPVFSEKSFCQEFTSGCAGLNGSSKSLTSTHPMLKESQQAGQPEAHHHIHGNGIHALPGSSAATHALSACLPALIRAKSHVLAALRGLNLRTKHWLLLIFVLFLIFLGIVFGFSGSSKPSDDVPNSPTLQQAAITKLLKEVPLIDGHNDLPWNIRKFVHNKLDSVNFTHNLKYVEPWAKSKWSHTDISRLMEGQVGCQLWVAYAPCGSQHKDAVQVTLEQIDLIKRLADAYPNQLKLVKTSEDITDTHTSGRIGSLITVESGHSIGTSLAVLRMFHRLGARSLTLTHNCHTPWADCSKADGPDGKPVHYGLTQFGRTVVEEMNRLGMIVDLSHSSIQTASDAIAVSDAPVIYSHSCAQKLCNSTRNIPDNLLRLVADKKGLVMVNFFSYFLTCNNHSTMNDVIAHLNHIRKVAGIDHVGIGASYDGINSTPAGLEDVSRYPALFVSLLASGTWSLDDLRKLAGLNFLRVFREVERVSVNYYKQTPLEEIIPGKDLLNTECKTEKK